MLSPSANGLLSGVDVKPTLLRSNQDTLQADTAQNFLRPEKNEGNDVPLETQFTRAGIVDDEPNNCFTKDGSPMKKATADFCINSNLKVELAGRKNPLWHSGTASKKRHFEKHGEEFGSTTTQEEYLTFLKKFAASTEKNVVMTFPKHETEIKIQGTFQDFSNGAEVLIMNIKNKKNYIKTFYKWNEDISANPLKAAVKKTVDPTIEDTVKDIDKLEKRRKENEEKLQELQEEHEQENEQENEQEKEKLQSKIQKTIEELNQKKEQLKGKDDNFEADWWTAISYKFNQ